MRAKHVNADVCDSLGKAFVYVDVAGHQSPGAVAEFAAAEERIFATAKSDERICR